MQSSPYGSNGSARFQSNVVTDLVGFSIRCRSKQNIINDKLSFRHDTLSIGLRSMA